MGSKVEAAVESGEAKPEINPAKLIFTDLCLRTLLFAASLTAMVVMLTSKQTELVQTTLYPVPVPVSAKFYYSPAFTYLVAATALSTLYSIITGAASSWVNAKPCSSKQLLKYYLILIAHDVLILGVMATSVGTAGGVGYVGWKGNSHMNWNKICNVYDKFCDKLAASLALSVFASLLLTSLIVLSAYSIYRVAQKVVVD